MKTPVSLLLALLGLSACTTARFTEPNTREATRMAQLGREHPAIVEFNSGERTSALLVVLDGDTLRWFDEAQARNRAVHAAKIRAVTINRHGAGGVQGLGLGFMVGAGVGTLAGLVEGGSGWFSTGEIAVLYGTLLGGIGAGTGAVLGFGRGRRDRFVLPLYPSAPAEASLSAAQHP